jgi:nucleoside-triphosphatase THEP1
VVKTTADSGRRRCILITGAVDSGKTSYARALAKQLRSRGIKTAGISANAEYEEGTKSRYRAVDLKSGESRLLMDDRRELGGGRIGRFSMSAEGFAWAEESLLRAMDEGAAAICLDEAGPLELRGGGYAAVLKRLLQDYYGLLIVVVRESVIDEVEAIVRDHGWRTERRSPRDEIESEGKGMR